MSILASTKRLMSDNWPLPEVPEPEPEPLFDDEHFELVNGQLVEKAMGFHEQWVDSKLHAFFILFLHVNDIGRAVMEAKFALPNTGNRRIPDLAYISYETWPKSKPFPRTAYAKMAPDLAVEVISPSDGGRDIVDKVLEYFRAGCKAVWVVWPNAEQIHAYSSPKSVKIYGITDILEGDPVVPGFRLPLIELFPPEESETP